MQRYMKIFDAVKLIILCSSSRIYRTWLFHVVVLWPFVNNGKEMNGAITHTLRAVTQPLYSLPLPVMVNQTPENRINGQIMNSKRAQNKWKTAESAENISSMKRNQNIYNDIPAILSPVVSRIQSLQLSTRRASNILGKTGYHVYK